MRLYHLRFQLVWCVFMCVLYLLNPNPFGIKKRGKTCNKDNEFYNLLEPIFFFVLLKQCWPLPKYHFKQFRLIHQLFLYLFPLWSKGTHVQHDSHYRSFSFSHWYGQLHCFHLHLRWLIPLSLSIQPSIHLLIHSYIRFRLVFWFISLI